MTTFKMIWKRSILMIALLTLLVGSTSVRTTAKAGAGVAAEESAVATVIPQGGGFRFQFNAGAVARTLPVYAKSEPNARGKVIKEDDFRDYIQSEGTRKLKEAFPNGVPSGMQSRVKVSVSFSCCPRTVTVTVSW
jgi:hypothetical protein